jgi:hypothetical protein
MAKQEPTHVTRAAALYGVIAHGNEMAGTAYVYLRSKNIVPPSTENAQRSSAEEVGLQAPAFTRWWSCVAYGAPLNDVDQEQHDRNDEQNV